MIAFLPESLACTVEIADTFSSKMTEADTAVAAQAEVKSSLLELEFIFTFLFAPSDWSKMITWPVFTRHVPCMHVSVVG